MAKKNCNEDHFALLMASIVFAIFTFLFATAYSNSHQQDLSDYQVCVEWEEKPFSFYSFDAILPHTSLGQIQGTITLPASSESEAMEKLKSDRDSFDAIVIDYKPSMIYGEHNRTVCTKYSKLERLGS